MKRTDVKRNKRLAQIRRANRTYRKKLREARAAAEKARRPKGPQWRRPHDIDPTEPRPPLTPDQEARIRGLEPPTPPPTAPEMPPAPKPSKEDRSLAADKRRQARAEKRALERDAKLVEKMLALEPETPSGPIFSPDDLEDAPTCPCRICGEGETGFKQNYVCTGCLDQWRRRCNMWSTLWKWVCEIGRRRFIGRGALMDGLISSPTYAQVQERTIHNLESAPFYAGLLKRSVVGHLRRYRTPREALTSRVIRQLYLQAERWIEAEKRVETLRPRLLNPERAFPRFKKKTSSLSPILMSREFDQAMLDGFATMDSAIYALRDLAVDRAQLLPQPQGRRGPDAEAFLEGATFPIEAKRVRGDEGFYKLQDEIDSRRALDPPRLARPSVSVKLPFAASHGGLELLSDEDLVMIGERFSQMAGRSERGRPLLSLIVVSQGHKITLELSDRYGPGHLDVMGTAGLLDPLDTSSLEVKVADKVREATAQLSAWHDDGVTEASDLAFIQVEFPGSMIFFSDEAERKITEIALDAGRQAGVRVKVSCSWS